MDRFFHPQKIVLFGASSNPHKGGHHVLKNIKQYVQHNENIEFFIIHPREDIIEGVQCYRDIAEINPDKIVFDLAIIVVPINAVMDTIHQCIKHDVRGILIESGQLDNDPIKAKENSLPNYVFYIVAVKISKRKRNCLLPKKFIQRSIIITLKL